MQNRESVCDILNQWAAPRPLPEVPADIPHGDMPGDKVQISAEHIRKAGVIFPRLCALTAEACAGNPAGRAVVAVCGGSGVGKSEIASILAYYFARAGVGAYTLSGDNYPLRIPAQNDAERQRVFRCGGTRGLVADGLCTAENTAVLRRLWTEDRDADPACDAQYPWMKVYRREGRKALAGYLGTPREQGFDELSEILARFKNGADRIWLKRMGRTEDALWYEPVSFAGTSVLLIEWTHGNSDFFTGVDIPVLLNSTPQETAEHRRSRGRDGKVDSPFTTMVLELEQNLLQSQAPKARLIVSKSGELLSYGQYCAQMARAAGGAV